MTQLESDSELELKFKYRKLEIHERKDSGVKQIFESIPFDRLAVCPVLFTVTVYSIKRNSDF